MSIVIPRKNYPSLIRNYTAMIVIVMVAGGYYFFTQYQQLTMTRAALAKEQETLTVMQSELSKNSNQYNEFKKTSDEKFKSVLDSMGKIYPAYENYTDIPRFFDKFVENNRSPENPVEISDIKLGVARIEPNKDYSILPITLTISGSQKNFLKFLKMIENSGELSDRSRLMEIRSISINFTNANGGAGNESREPLLNVSVGINAYFQKGQTTTTTN